MNKLKITNKAGRFYVGANIPTPHWIPLPETLKTRDQVLDHYKNAEVLFCNESGQHCRKYEIYYHYYQDAPLQIMAVEDESQKLVIDLPVTAKQDEIENWLLSRAKSEGFENIITEYREDLLD